MWAIVLCVKKKKYKEPGKMMTGSRDFTEQGTSSLKKLSDHPGGYTWFNFCFFKEVDSDPVTVCLFSSKIGKTNKTFCSVTVKMISGQKKR